MWIKFISLKWKYFNLVTDLWENFCYKKMFDWNLKYTDRFGNGNLTFSWNLDLIAVGKVHLCTSRKTYRIRLVWLAQTLCEARYQGRIRRGIPQAIFFRNSTTPFKIIIKYLSIFDQLRCTSIQFASTHPLFICFSDDCIFIKIS